MQQTYSRRLVERSFRKFNDIVSDLFQAKFQTWGNTFNHLMTHCEEDSAMKVVTEPLRKNPGVDAEKWYKDALGSMRGMVGSGHYELPYDDDDRTALLYQFFVLVNNNNVDFTRFCMCVYGTTAFQDSVHHFNQELVLKFTREVSYRLDEILSDLGESQEVPREAMIVFHHHDHTLNIHGNVQGSNIAVGGSLITDSTAAYATNADLADAIRALKPLVKEIAESQRESVEAALDVLVSAVDDKTVTQDEVQKAASTVAASSPTIRQRLTDIGKKIGLSLVSSSIFQGIKMALGIS